MFDNIKDVRQKFEKTICYYDGKAVFVHQIQEGMNGDFVMMCYYPAPAGSIEAGKQQNILLSDPKFTYRNYNLGYLHVDRISCPWLYRMPYRQYKQGLHLSTQVASTMFEGELVSYVSFGQQVAEMLENKYPSLDQCLKQVRDGTAIKRAPHKDFALSYDRLHEDYQIEYRGNLVGVVFKGGDLKLMKEWQHLQEVLREEVLAC